MCQLPKLMTCAMSHLESGMDVGSAGMKAALRHPCSVGPKTNMRDLGVRLVTGRPGPVLSLGKRVSHGRWSRSPQQRATRLIARSLDHSRAFQRAHPVTCLLVGDAAPRHDELAGED